MKLLLKAVLIILLAFILFQSRRIFTYKYEPEYFENYFYESQYSYPSSARGISDGMLYKFVGYRLTQGENPFYINWEIPPFAKALYGYSSRLFGNPYWFSVACFFGSLAILYLLIKNNFKNPVLPLVGMLMLILIPHFSNQISDTMLDLPLTFAFLIHIFFFFKYLTKKDIKFLIFSGIFLGIASAIKPPVYTPFILLEELFIVYLNEKNLKRVLFFPLFALAGYMAGYFVYFMRHPNPIPWVRLHDKIYSFYLGSGLTIQPFGAIKEMFNTGSWGFIFIAGLVSYFIAWFVYFRKKNDLKLLTLLILSTIFIAVNSLIPFFPRYLLPLSFIFVLLTLYIFENKLIPLLIICIISLPFFYRAFGPTIPDGDAQATARFIQTRADRELYRAINPEYLTDISENDFINTLENFNSAIGTMKIDVEVGQAKKVEGKYYYDFKIVYFTRNGLVENEIPFVYENKAKSWKLNWNWDDLYKNYNPQEKIEFGIKPVNTVVNYEVYVVPRLMYDWNQSLQYLSYLTGLATTDINTNLTSVVPNDFEKFVGYLDNKVPDSEREKLIGDKGEFRVKEVNIDKKMELENNFLLF